jgi:hypothetical protein
MTIYVIGSGCPTCKKLYEITQKAVTEMRLKEKVFYLTGSEGIQKLMKLGAMSSPIITVNDKIVLVGFTPDTEKIKNAIRKASKQ